MCWVWGWVELRVEGAEGLWVERVVERVVWVEKMVLWVGFEVGLGQVSRI